MNALGDESAKTTATTTQPADQGGYQAVQGGAESRSGETLLVEAYVVLWVILMAWLYGLWRAQSRLHTRIDELEKVIDKAEARKAA